MSKFLSNYKYDANISNKKLENIEIFKENLNYMTVKKTIFIQSSFKNCDIVGCKFYNTDFVNVLLNNADIISLCIYDCTFVNVCFDGTCIEDIDFQNCTFKNCSFNNFTMKNCSFKECSFNNFKPNCCLCELNNYIDCSFVDSEFSSSFHYQIFSGCEFQNTSTTIELLGYNYGLLSNNQINIVNLNLNFDNSHNNLEYLYEKYIKQKQFINALVLRINYEYDENVSIMLLWADFLETIIKNGLIIKANEILFIKNIISYFSTNNKIPPILLFELNNKLISIINQYPISSQKTKDDIILLINSIYFEFKKHAHSFYEKNTQETLFTGKNIVIEVKYLEKPKVDLSYVLNQFGCGKCCQIRTANGSFYEWISCPDNIISCLEILLMLLGIVTPIVYDTIKTKKKKSKSQQLEFLNLSEDSPTNITINMTINNGCHILNNCNFIENNFYGYDNQNVQKIKISVEK